MKEDDDDDDRDYFQFNIKAVLAAAELPFEQGVIRERELFTTLFMSGQSKALQYYFFALRAAPKVGYS